MNTAAAQAETVIHPVYLPFSPSQLRSHFPPVACRSQEELERHVQYFVESAARYSQFCEKHPSRTGYPMSFLKAACQTEKDERFWVASCWLSFYYSSARTEVLSRLMGNCFGERPPITGFQTWAECFEGDLKLYLEAFLPSPPSYKTWLAAHVEERNLIPYTLAAAAGSLSSLEGPTHCDTILINSSNGFGIVVEAKVMSDISDSVTFDTLRNQLARSIDVSLDWNPSLPAPLSQRDPEKTLILLQTPHLFRRFPHSRLYGWLFNEYRNNPKSLLRDLSHRHGMDCHAVSARLGWLTWEDCKNILPEVCVWLT